MDVSLEEPDNELHREGQLAKSSGVWKLEHGFSSLHDGKRKFVTRRKNRTI